VEHAQDTPKRAAVHAAGVANAAPQVANEARPSTSVRRILRLQRQVGNIAVRSFLARWHAPTRQRSASGLLQRWVGTEHQALGDSGLIRDVDLGNGVTLTFGQVVAVAGDEYPNVDALRRDTHDDEGRARIRAALEHAGVLDARTTTSLPEPTEAQKSAHVLDYINLLLNNTAHFVEGGAIDEWVGQHTSAVSQAMAAGQANLPGDLNKAQASEAFAQHFLTDAFSGGHARTPRKAITDWYVSSFAPRITDRFISTLKERLVSEFTLEVFAQLGGMVPPGPIHDKIEKEADKQLTDAVTKIGGHNQLVQYFGLAVAGAVSGALHDMEGERGVWVSSKAHPEPFQAFGDTLLDDPRNTTNKSQAQLAVKAGQDDLNAAYTIGEKYASDQSITAGDLPTMVHFAFDSSTLTPADSVLIGTAGAYMALHPETRVDLTGHTDPLGSPSYNSGLGMRRAEAVASVLMQKGAQPTQITTGSDGEDRLLTNDPKQFNLDRRTEFVWRSAEPTPGQANEAVGRAQQELQATVGPPFQKVQDLIPHPTDSGQSPNVALEDWHWGSMPQNLVARLDQWAHEHLGPYTGVVVDKVPVEIEKDLVVTTVRVHPQAAVKKVVDDLMAGPSAFLGHMFGQEAGGK
jgi:outer membrane protein OmpA-like peptidoglycan-associated protein